MTDLDIAIRALARQTTPNVRLDIKGRGEYLPVLKQLAAELGISEQAIFSDPCRTEEIVDFVAHGAVGIIPYRCDGFEEVVLPTKAYEFAWMHRLMIASNTAGILSTFKPESILLCDPDQPEGFAEVIVDLYQHPEKRVHMVASTDADYVPYRWETMSERYCQLLVTLMSHPELLFQKFTKTGCRGRSTLPGFGVPPKNSFFFFCSPPQAAREKRKRYWSQEVSQTSRPKPRQRAAAPCNPASQAP